jgi:hypothetical protein
MRDRKPNWEAIKADMALYACKMGVSQEECDRQYQELKREYREHGAAVLTEKGWSDDCWWSEVGQPPAQGRIAVFVFGKSVNTARKGKRMRKQLECINEQRLQFEATFERYGTKVAFKGPPIDTILLRNVTRTDNGEVVADHLWFTRTVGFASLGKLEVGDKVQFHARVSRYEKGYRGRLAEERGEAWCEYDYRLSYPTRICKVSSGDGKHHPAGKNNVASSPPSAVASPAESVTEPAAAAARAALKAMEVNQ